jgi:hypothetical protein
VVTTRETAYAELAADAGVRSILQATIYSEDVTYAAIVDAGEVAVAASDTSLVGQPLPPAGSLDELLAKNGLAQVWEIWNSRGRTLEWRAPLLLGDESLGASRPGHDRAGAGDGHGAFKSPCSSPSSFGGAAADSVIQSSLTRLPRRTRARSTCRKPRCRTCAASSTPCARNCGACRPAAPPARSWRSSRSG